MLEEYEGVIAEIIFHNDGNGYTVAVFETEEAAFTVVGSLPAVSVGKSYRLQGKFTVNPRYGEQFAISSFEEIMPSTKDGIREFLSSGALKGIGKKTAAAIVATFGEETFEIIEQNPERLVEVPGIGVKTAQKISDAFADQREFARVVMELQQYGIGAAQTLKLYNVYGADTVEIILENPYTLIDNVYGVGFRKADKIAEKIGIKKDDEFRIQSGIKFTLNWFAGEGNTFLPESELCEKTGELLDLPRELIENNIEIMAFMGELHIDLIEEQRVVYLRTFYEAEQNICKILRQLTNATLKPINGVIDSLIMRTEAATGIALSAQQKEAVTGSLSRGVSVITGGPGTGKTTIINTLIDILEDSGFETAIAAPTGRAAKRITETSGHYASTIHRLLEYSFFEEGNGGGFGRNDDNPLEYDAVIVDEASMIDLMLMNNLLKAILPGTRLIIVGDDDQLPSVGAGNVLRDIIASEYIHCTKLTEIFRQARESMIVVNAHRINRGEYPDCNVNGKDFFMLHRRSEVDMLETIKELCTKRLPDYYSDIVPGGLKPARDIQVLTPVRKGRLGCINLNRELQEVMNPAFAEDNNPKAEKQYGDKLFREGDKVMQIRNNYELKWRNHEDFSDGEGIFNGDIGVIVHIDHEYSEMTVVFDDVRYVTYNFSQLDELELAYAVTVHKSQGSEFPIVIMPISWFPPVLATRNLLYTGVTRGKHIVVLVGSEDKLCGMVDNNRISYRYSGLAFRLKKFFEFE